MTSVRPRHRELSADRQLANHSRDTETLISKSLPKFWMKNVEEIGLSCHIVTKINTQQQSPAADQITSPPSSSPGTQLRRSDTQNPHFKGEYSLLLLTYVNWHQLLHSLYLFCRIFSCASSWRRQRFIKKETHSFLETRDLTPHSL